MILAALRTPDIVVLFVYFALLIGAGFYFRKRSGTVEGFTVANRSLPGWVVGLSVFGTYLSSNTFLFTKETKQDMFGPNVVVIEVPSLFH